MLLPFVHLSACAADLVGGQVALMGLFCTVSDRPLLSYAATALIGALFLALPLGFLALRYRRLRPVYVVLLALIPITVVGLDRLVAAGIFTCDGP